MTGQGGKIRKITGLFTLVLACALMNGCTALALSGKSDPNAEIGDPMESYNRAVMSFNEALDKALLEPVARGYRGVIPRPVRTAVRNFLRNLHTPVNVANQALQGDVTGAARDTSRFIINSSIGLVGLIDVAKDTGIRYEHEDFGQTLAVWGVGHGPYTVLPFLGPSSLRDATGMGVDTFADPVRLYLYNTDNEGWYYARVATHTIDAREELLDAIDDLRKHSFDYYAAVRSAYVQRRNALVHDEEPGTFGAAQVHIPDYDAGEQ